MSSKISALPAAPTVSNLDTFTLLQGGVNKKCTRLALLQKTVTEIIGFLSPAFFSGYDASDNWLTQIPAAGTWTVVLNGTPVVGVDASGHFFVTVPAGAQINLSANGAVINIDAAGNITVTLAGGAVLALPYVAANPANWAGGVPSTDQWAANDRFAAALTAAGFPP